MKDTQLHKLMDLIEEIKKVDAMVKLHTASEESDFMAMQYQAIKDKLIGCLIDDLVSPSLRSPRSYFTIKLILEKFYPDLSTAPESEEANFEDLAALEAAL